MQNIVDSVDNSRKFVVVLSPGYVKSKWCMFELFLAQSRMLDSHYSNFLHSDDKLNCAQKFTRYHQQSNLIVIVKQKLDSNKIARRLEVMLRMWTYLEWPTSSMTSAASAASTTAQTSFWHRLASCVNTVRI